jgi:hypothetical protein
MLQNSPLVLSPETHRLVVAWIVLATTGIVVRPLHTELAAAGSHSSFLEPFIAKRARRHRERER